MPSSSRSFSYPVASYTSANFTSEASPRSYALLLLLWPPLAFSSSSSPPCLTSSSVRFFSEQPPGFPRQRSMVVMKLERSVSQLRELASKSASSCVDEFASKLF
ncbi:uncharacterized protein DS421_19g656270 [Arachis hypogaea]|uniref:Uncharacterized protein n=1 Tax=Arachis hypogaea TaxID=3818 RepID=A0A6B9VAQ9_ARAHY|nr:uncharacterized protein DS421_19g656270 [Arachis hypogaea]